MADEKPNAESEERGSPSAAAGADQTRSKDLASLKIGGLLAAIVVASVLLRLPLLHVPMITDEGGCAYVAKFWSHDHQLYRDINYDRLQGLFVIYKVILATFGESTAAIRLAASLYTGAATAAVFLVARSLSDARAGLIAAALFAVFGAAPAIEGFTANSELFAILPLTLSAWLALRRRWWWAGLLAGLAVLFKPIGVSGWLLAVAWAAVGREDQAKPPWRDMVVLSAGFAVGPSLAALHGVYVGWEHFWHVFVQERLLGFSVASTPAAVQLARLASGVSDTFVAWLCPGILTAAAIALSGKAERRFAAIWLVASVVGMSLGGNWYLHYFVQILPPVCALAGVGAVALLRGGWRTRTLWGAPALLALGWFVLRQGPYWTWEPKKISWELYHRPEYLVADEVATFIRDTTDPSDTMYVAFGQADLYYRARRHAAVPHQLYWRQVESNQAIWDEVVAAIAERKPKVIVLVQPPPPQWATPRQFLALVQRGYLRDPRMPLLPVYRRRPVDAAAVPDAPDVTSKHP